MTVPTATRRLKPLLTPLTRDANAEPAPGGTPQRITATLVAVDAKLATAKAAFAKACAACVSGRLDHETLVRDALAAVDAARSALRALCDEAGEGE